MLDKTLPQTPCNGLGRIVPIGLQAAALALLVLLLLKAVFDVDNHFDSWWYHLPWAARLAGLVPPDLYMFEPIAADRFDGFPVLPELLQGLLWRVTGRVESANLVSFGSLVAFVLFLRHFFRVPWWLTVPALLAVPLVQAHATSTYVDLIANLSMAALVLLTYLAYVQRDAIRPTFVAAMAASAFVAANSKFQLIPLVALTLAFAAFPMLRWLRNDLPASRDTMRLSLRMAALALVMLAIFMVPVKNLIQHGNPVYPVKLVILGHVLNGPESLPPEALGGGILTDAPRAKKWFYSVAEIGMGNVRNVQRWTLDSAAPAGSPLGIQGGLFGVYVGFHLLAFSWLVSRAGRRERKAALVLVGLVTGLAALMPASHLLRYYMFWFVCVISLNLHFISTRGSNAARWVAGIAFFCFVLVVVDASDQNFVRPRFHSVQTLLAEKVDTRILQELSQSGPSCLALDRANQPFLYASIWHPGTHFSIKAGPFFPHDSGEVEQACAGKHIIFSTR
ncbi:hypothetical protein [Thiobacillus sp.]